MSSAMKLLEPAIKAVTTVKFFESYVDKSGRLTWDNYKDQLEKASLFPRQRFPRALENDSQCLWESFRNAFGKRFPMASEIVSQGLWGKFENRNFSWQMGDSQGLWETITKGFENRFPQGFGKRFRRASGIDSQGLWETIPKCFGNRFPKGLRIDVYWFSFLSIGDREQVHSGGQSRTSGQDKGCSGCSCGRICSISCCGS